MARPTHRPWESPGSPPADAPTPSEHAPAPEQRGDIDGDALLPLGTGVPADDEPPRRRKGMLIAIAVLAGLATISVILFGPTAWRMYQQRGAKVSLPAQVGPYTLDTGSEAKEHADWLRNAVLAVVSLDKTVDGVYKRDADNRVLIVAGTATVFSPGRELDALLEQMKDTAGGVSDLREIPPGPLGGVVKCGASKIDEKSVPVCGWGDHGSLAIAMFTGGTVDQAAETIRDLRKAMLQRR